MLVSGNKIAAKCYASACWNLVAEHKTFMPKRVILQATLDVAQGGDAVELRNADLVFDQDLQLIIVETFLYR